MEKLAVDGGAPAFTHPFMERWTRPKDLEKKLLGDLIDADQLSDKGKGITRAFEEAFAKYIGCTYCIAFDHGTSALMAAYYAVGVGPGDEVITPAVGWLQSYSGALHLGARPILADIHPKTLLLDPAQVKPTSRTKALNNIHLNGRINDLDALLALGLPLVDDASHVHGASWRGKKIGNADHITCFSLQGANPYGKPVSGGEGGLACTNDRSLYQRMLAYSQFNRSNLQKELEGSPFEKLGKTVLGLKFRPHPMAMGLALISLQSLDERNRKIAAHIAKLRALLKRFDLFTFPEMPQHAAMGGIFGGLHLIADHPDVEKLVSLLQAEGMPILGPMVGHLEYKSPLLSEGFDLWGQGRGPLDKSWEGLSPYVAPKPSDFPVAEALKSRVVQVPAFIDVDPEYFICFERALEKVYAHLRK